MRRPLALAVLLAACQSPAPDPAASPEGAPAEAPPAEPPASDLAIPDPFVGTWDEDAGACAASFSMTRFSVSPTGIDGFGGTGDVTAVRDDGDGVEVSLSYLPDGSASDEPEPARTALRLDDAGRLALGLGGGREGLVRCGDPTPRDAGRPAAGGEDQTVTVRFAPGASALTLSDTLRTFALRDYLVRAAAGQRLTATLRADGPGAPTAIVIRESTYRGPEGAFETLAPDAQGPPTAATGGRARSPPTGRTACAWRTPGRRRMGAR